MQSIIRFIKMFEYYNLLTSIAFGTISGSPFKCEVRELEPREVRHLQRKESQMVTAKGDGLKQVRTNLVMRISQMRSNVCTVNFYQ